MTIFLSLWAFSLNPISAAESADWGDVIDVNYSLWLDQDHTIEKEGNIDRDLLYVYLRKSPSDSVPSEVLNAFPKSVALDLNRTYLQNFIKVIIGMRVNQEKDFMIAAEDAYGVEDLYYHIKLLRILYDASEHVITTTTTTTTATTTITGSPAPYQGLTELLIFGGGAVILGGGFVLWRYSISRTYKSAQSREENKSVKQAKTFQKEKDHLRELRKLTESVTDSDVTPKKTEVKFRPRRR
ncbi:MAG: hypothetical protein JSU57_05090 [Candidatus Heimdallarchaeota archaeon]|nr:MAG: hypothetical protein JSU57_05090 [Candidatus Heimdallarchaeota archaeon]